MPLGVIPVTDLTPQQRTCMVHSNVRLTRVPSSTRATRRRLQAPERAARTGGWKRQGSEDSAPDRQDERLPHRLCAREPARELKHGWTRALDEQRRSRRVRLLAQDSKSHPTDSIRKKESGGGSRLQENLGCNLGFHPR